MDAHPDVPLSDVPQRLSKATYTEDVKIIINSLDRLDVTRITTY